MDVDSKDGLHDKAKLVASRPDNLHKGANGSSDLDLDSSTSQLSYITYMSTLFNFY